jgi:hypothetical protein
MILESQERVTYGITQRDLRDVSLVNSSRHESGYGIVQ